MKLSDKLRVWARASIDDQYDDLMEAAELLDSYEELVQYMNHGGSIWYDNGGTGDWLFLGRPVPPQFRSVLGLNDG